MAIEYTAIVNGKSYGFDFDDQRIDIDVTIDSMIVGNLWTAIKEAQATVHGISFPVIATGEGLATLGTGVTTFLTVTLQDNWEVNTLKSSGKFEVGGGNLIREDQADPFRDNPLITYIAFLSQAGIATQIETGVSGLTPTESNDLASTKADAARLAALLEDVSGDRFTAKALEAAPGGSGGTDVNVISVGGTAVASPDDLKADVSALATAASIAALNDPTVAAIVSGVWDEVLTGATHNIQNSAGKRLRDIASQVIWTGTAQSGGTNGNQIQLDAGASGVNGAYDPAIIAIIDGTGAGQSRLILEYNGVTKVATVDRSWKVIPDATSEFIVYAFPGREHVNEGLAQGGTSNTITLNALASDIDDNYNNQVVFIRSGTGEDQSGIVMSYNGTTKVATMSTNWAIVPDTTSAYVMLPYHVHELSEITAALDIPGELASYGVSTFDNTTDEVTTDDASRKASRAKATISL